MKIAVVCDNNKVSQHFGRCEGFYVYDGENKTYHESLGHGEIPKQLKELGVDFVACGGIGQGAIEKLEAYKIKAFTGLEGFCDDIADGFFRDILVTGRQGCCGGGHHDHDHHHHHDHGHKCKCSGK